LHMPQGRHDAESSAGGCMSDFEDMVLDDDDQLGPQEEAAIIAMAIILSRTQLEATIHFFAHEIARRDGVTEHMTIGIEINKPENEPSLIVLPGGKK
jgi:hypothetical protein